IHFVTVDDDVREKGRAGNLVLPLLHHLRRVLIRQAGERLIAQRKGIGQGLCQRLLRSRFCFEIVALIGIRLTKRRGTRAELCVRDVPEQHAKVAQLGRGTRFEREVLNGHFGNLFGQVLLHAGVTALQTRSKGDLLAGRCLRERRTSYAQKAGDQKKTVHAMLLRWQTEATLSWVRLQSLTPATSNMTLDEFKATLDDAQPPVVAPVLRALWYAAKGKWDEAHTIAQDINDSSGAWVHAYLHRVEGDQENARYWYRRAGHIEATDGLEAEWARIATALLAQS